MPKNNDLHTIQNFCPVCNQPGQYVYIGKDLLYGLAEEFIYAKCTQCGAVYQDRMPSPEQIASFYPEEYAPYRPGEAKERNALEKSVLRTKYGYRHLKSFIPNWLGICAGWFVCKNSIPFTEKGRLLDIGCGGGKFLLSMQRLGWISDGVEFNERAVQTCRESGLRVFYGELANASLANNSFDVVTARHVIEHIAETHSFVEEIYRIVKPGGLLVIQTPNSDALARNWFGTNWFADDVPRHLVLYSASNLRLLAGKHGFREKFSRTSTSPKYILNSWDYLKSTQGKPSRKRKLRRMVAKFYVAAASLTGRGDEIFSIFEKPVDE